jgi:hypothetical protein
MKRHNLKILAMYYAEVAAGIRNFQVRRYDRDYQVGDTIKLNEVDSKGISELKPTGNACIVEITSILRSTPDAPFEGIEVGHSILGTKLIYAPPGDY